MGNRDVNKAMSPPPIIEDRPLENGHESSETKPQRKEKKKLSGQTEVNEEVTNELPKESKKVESTTTQLVDIEPTKEEKPQQSYLALTGLGGPEKKQEPKQNAQGSSTSAASMIGGLFRR